MRIMYIANNRLSSLSSFDHLRSLTFLDVSKNNLDNVSRESNNPDSVSADAQNLLV
jgi:Leucine-rich repeat (LRR) protein